MMTSEPYYKSYLLRLWIEHSLESEQDNLLRFSLEDAISGKRQGFTSLDNLIAFLRDEAKRQLPKQEIRPKEEDRPTFAKR